MQSFALSHQGCVRTQNQDSFGIEALSDECVLGVVCDGMGGARSGNVASSLAVEVFTQELKNSYRANMDQEALDNMLRCAVKLVNFAVYDQAGQFADFAGMGTTLVATLIEQNRVTIVNVGDSRAYYVNQDGIRAVTLDHSIVQMMVDRGELTAEEAKHYPGKNLITRAIGTDPSVECDLFHLEMTAGECILLCSDGLSNLVDEQELLFEVLHGEHMDDCCERLLSIAINRGAPDNVTCMLLQA